VVYVFHSVVQSLVNQCGYFYSRWYKVRAEFLISAAARLHLLQSFLLIYCRRMSYWMPPKVGLDDAKCRAAGYKVRAEFLISAAARHLASSKPTLGGIQ
jgi:hypothetical protein